jgi:Skp family chaperone for outer membrane proteins
MNTPDTLALAVAEHRATIAAHRTRYGALVKQLATAPTDKTVLAEVAAISSELAARTAGLQALEAALESARDTEATEQAAKAKADGRKRVGALIEKTKRRRASYDRLARTSTDFIAALKDHLDEGAVLRTEAAAVARQLFGDRAGEHAQPVDQAAAGTSASDHVAVASFIREVVELYGAHRVERYVAVDSFVRGVSFDDAFAANASVVVGLEKA